MPPPVTPHRRSGGRTNGGTAWPADGAADDGTGHRAASCPALGKRIRQRNRCRQRE